MDESSNQPGQVILPGGSDNTPRPPEQAPGGSPEPQRPTPTEQPDQPTPTPQSGTSNQAVDGLGINRPFDQEAQESNIPTGLKAPDLANPTEDISWTASEFISHEKSPGWYAALGLAAIILGGAAYLLTGHNIISIIAIVLAILMLGISARQKPRVRQYTLGNDGLHIDNRTYLYSDFKSFTASEDGAIVSVIFLPLQRFAPGLTIYLAPEMEDTVIDALSDYLPHESHRQDAVDGLLKRIRF
ncbi:MAG: hypothetical protein ABI220_02305 [Candidatus Saccharimonadales bacterium]